MATARDVLTMLIPDGGWIVTGNDYKGIQFIACDPITEKQFLDGFAVADKWLQDEASKKATQREAILNRLGITADEVALLLG
jgi:hypothetical protein